MSDSGEHMVFESTTGTITVVGHVSAGCRGTSKIILDSIAYVLFLKHH